MNIELKWSDFKSLNTTKSLHIQYVDIGKFYRIWTQEDGVFYVTEVYKESETAPTGSDQKDFEDNYKTDANQPTTPKDVDGKQYIRAESRPLDKTTYFTCAGDSTTEIGNGKKLCWDFSNTDDDNTDDVPTGYKKKRIEFKFLDAFNIKEGAIYFQNAKQGTYIELSVVCPSGSYYLNNNGTPALASEDTQIDKFVNNHFIYGNCNLGDELNTEASSSEIPAHYKLWVEVFTLTTDNDSFGHVSLEIYRNRTRVL